jgi:hypothetical protein
MLYHLQSTPLTVRRHSISFPFLLLVPQPKGLSLASPLIRLPDCHKLVGAMLLVQMPKYTCICMHRCDALYECSQVPNCLSVRSVCSTDHHYFMIKLEDKVPGSP